jgi:dTDP-4-amino-4,6-dideoxygalactose transaminase
MTQRVPTTTPRAAADGRPGARRPLFGELRHVGRPNLGNREALLRRIESALDRNWLTNNGPLVQEFEAEVARYLGVRHAIAMANATIGLQIAVMGLDLSGDVIVPSFTFPATVHALAIQGVRPVFCDVDPETHNLDPQAVECLIRPTTTGILGVHLWGNACAVEALTAIAEEHRLRLCFDAAHAFGCSHGGRMIGNFGDAEVFSFHATKFVNSGEGGMITTNNDGLANKFRQLRNFGLERDAVVGLGTNGKMCEFSAAMGLTSLESRGQFVARNRENLSHYQHVLAGIPGLTVRSYSKQEHHNHQYVVVEVDERAAGISRDRIITALHAENVLAKRYFFPGCHQLEPYRSLNAAQPESLPETERLCERLLQLPTGTAVSEADITRIGGFLETLVGRARVAA